MDTLDQMTDKVSSPNFTDRSAITMNIDLQAKRRIDHVSYTIQIRICEIERSRGRSRGAPEYSYECIMRTFVGS